MNALHPAAALPQARRAWPGARRTGLALLTLVLALVLAACSPATPPDTHPQRWVSQRQAVFKDFTRTLEPMGLVARERKAYNPAEFAGQALALQQLSQKPWALFPADSQYPPTRAKPAVWAEPAAFEAAQQAYLQAVDALLAAAQTGTLQAIKPAVEDVQARCKACHEKFRLDGPAR
jgi:cytochrome c556